MPEYVKSEARRWARQNLHGVTGIVLPSYTPDFVALDQEAIGNDIARNIELGFWGSLAISEPCRSIDEYVSLVRASVAAAKGTQYQIMHYASFDTLAMNIEAAKLAADAGASLSLLAYPPSFRPSDSEEIYRYTREFCDRTELGVVLFPVPLWGFERLHPAALDPDIVVRLVEDCPNIVAIKSEGGLPTMGGFAQLRQRVGDAVIVTIPIEQQVIPLRQLGIDISWMPPSDAEIYGDIAPRMMRLLDEGEHEAAWDLFWQVHPARLVHGPVSLLGGHAIHWGAWKYIGWLNGMNGGVLPIPCPTLEESQMRAVRAALIKSKVAVTEQPDELFYIGRTAAARGHR
ncbi:dihydrodipicolinate synthase family protein [Mycobacterium avium]|uniref:dihydrodipicolinate synthase family protein n=1 Tax=Mycobacterium avium TaxID=1764 RepID=UPI001CC77CDF|nr:dihydrodipicolinate synthase family protein [Mycobacterium avium]MBZ4521799.1 dihydrodipicolinate synthase family protein [Mycobacterium avium subsp. hominissuis]MBZ4531189.1 dihydrodipicolinate synthase family protein [Mycobacterium avium subsp. hominissuis]